MGKRADAEMAELETSVKKSKKVKALVQTVAEEVEPEALKKEKKHKREKPSVEEDVEAKAPLKEKKRKKEEQTEAEAEVDADEEKRKRKEERKKMKQAAAEAAAADEEDADFAEAEAEAEAAAAQEDAPKKKIKTDAGTPKSKTVLPPFVHIDDQTVFAGGIPFSCTLDGLRKEFSKCGEIQCLKLPGNLKGNRGIAFITFASKEGAKKAIRLDGQDYGGRTLRVNLAGEKRPEKVKEAKEGNGDEAKSNGKGNRAFQVFVGGLPFQATEAILRKDFGECGEIRSFDMPLNEAGKPKGFMFVTYETQEAVDKALAFNNTSYGSRILSVSKVEGKKKRLGKAEADNDE